MGMLHRVINVFEKLSFYDELKGVWDVNTSGDLVMCMGDCDGILMDLMRSMVGLAKVRGICREECY